MNYLNRAIDSINNDDKLKHLLFRALYQRGNAYFNNKQYQLAESDNLTCLNIIDSNSIYESQRDGIYSQLARIYHQTGQLRKGIDYMNQALLMSKQEKDAELTGQYSTLAMLYRENGQKDSCIYVFSEYVNYLFDKFNKNSVRSIASTGALFKVYEYQNRIETLHTQNLLKESQNRFQRIFIILLISFAIFISAISFLIYSQYIKTRKAYQTIKEKNNRIKKQEAEITILKEQKREELTDRFEHDLELLDRLMKEDKLYLQPDLNLTSVASILKINHTYLSSIINRHFGFSFTYFLNQYRIKEAVSLFDAGSHEKYSIEAISKIVGFKSKSAFYRAFRQHKSCTPTEYLNNSTSAE